MMYWGRRTKVLLAVGLVFVVAACAQGRLAIYALKQGGSRVEGQAAVSPDGVPIGRGGVYKVGEPYKVLGVTYRPRVDPTYDKSGIASWYGKDFNGLTTANGETYNMNALTAAHKTLPLPSYVRVTNLENGRSIVLRVNDRGPFVNGRIIDVSQRASQLLGFNGNGTARVRVRVITSPVDGSFIAEKAVTPKGRRVAVAAPVGNVETTRLEPLEGVTQAPPRRAAALPSVSLERVNPIKMFVQAGAFESFDNANRLDAELSGIVDFRVTAVIVDGRELFRVRYGPIDSVEQADFVLAAVIREGHPEAQIVID